MHPVPCQRKTEQIRYRAPERGMEGKGHKGGEERIEGGHGLSRQKSENREGFVELFADRE